jgi:hypothetical protein
MVTQTKLESLIEVSINIAIGFLVSYLAWPLCAYINNLDYDNVTQLNIVIFFTVLSVIRSYLIRRWFNARIHLVVVSIARRLIQFRSKT